MAVIADVSLYPWEDVDAAVRERAEQEIWSDAEYQQWLDVLLGKPVEEMGELEFMAYMADQLEAQPRLEGNRKVLSLAEEMLSLAMVQMFAPRSGGWSAALLAGEVEVLPDWQRDEYVGM